MATECCKDSCCTHVAVSIKWNERGRRVRQTRRRVLQVNCNKEAVTAILAVLMAIKGPGQLGKEMC